MSDDTSRGARSPLGRCVAIVLAAMISLPSVGCGGPANPTSTTSGAQLSIEQPADFGFVAAYGAYGKNEIDTFEGTFKKDIISQSKPNPTVQMRLTEKELASLYQDLRAMRILDYPSNMDSTNTGITASTPISYRLDILAGGVRKSIYWEHGEFGGTEQARALLAWFEKLRAMIEAKAEYQRMPPLEGGYA